MACRRCSNYIFILDLAYYGFIRLEKDNYKTRREIFKLGDLVRLILDIYGMLRILILSPLLRDTRHVILVAIYGNIVMSAFL